jgi:uncharacterized membrane protein YbhN (UPF0104 family)
MTASLVRRNAVAPVATVEEPSEPAPGTAIRRPWRAVLVAGVLALLAVEAVRMAPTMSRALASMTQAQPGWIAVAVLAAAGSMSMFARSRRRLMRGAGIDVPVRSAVAAVYVANALHTTLPGGAAFSTGYTYRWMRGWGASGPAATWTLVAGGVVSSVSLAALGVLGSLLIGSSAGWVSLVTALTGIAGAAYGVRALQRSPGAAIALARWAIVRINTVRHRPQTTGVEAVEEMVAQLRAVRPRGRDWLVAAAFATANWALDAGCLAAGAAALGVNGLTLAVLLLTYTAGMAASSLSLVPGGLGVVDAAMLLTLVAGGIPAAAALPVVLLYRLISLGGVVAVGWIVAAVQGVSGARSAAPVVGRRRGDLDQAGPFQDRARELGRVAGHEGLAHGEG